MLAFGLVMLAIGALLANVASAWVFAIVSLLLAAGGFAQGAYLGWPIGEALLIAAGLFVCGQVGYVIGIGARAFALAKFGRAEAERAPPAPAEPGFDKSGARLNGGH